MHRNGWMFQIPLTTRKTSGYLYNKELTSYDEAVKDFCKLKNIDENIVYNLRHFSWEERYRKNPTEMEIYYIVVINYFSLSPVSFCITLLRCFN
jgi:hypothetical protein